MTDPRDHCPTCGEPVRVVSSGEGTSHYESVAASRLAEVERERDGSERPCRLVSQKKPLPYAKNPPGARPTWRIYCDDSRTLLKQLPASSVDCVATSPPYYWQRDYGVKGQLGMEKSVEGFVENLVSVFEGIDHVLRADGVVFLNLGDTYDNDSARRLARRQLRAVDGPGLSVPRKSLLGIPWRVALALVDAGWTLRSEIIWVRRSSMPEPTAIDRPWRRHEHLFFFAKSTRYHFDREGLDGEEDVWEIEPERNGATRGKHYAPYPEALVERCLRAGCPEKGTVLDPFAGGGTTLAVAKRLGLKSIGVDLNPEFCDVTMRRMSGSNTASEKRLAKAGLTPS